MREEIQLDAMRFNTIKMDIDLLIKVVISETETR